MSHNFLRKIEWFLAWYLFQEGFSDGGRWPDFYGFTIDGIEKEAVLVHTLFAKLYRS